MFLVKGLISNAKCRLQLAEPEHRRWADTGQPDQLRKVAEAVSNCFHQAAGSACLMVRYERAHGRPCTTESRPAGTFPKRSRTPLVPGSSLQTTPRLPAVGWVGVYSLALIKS